MQNGYRKIQIFIASPTDVNKERETTERVIKKLQKNYANSKKIYLELVKWETDTYSDIKGEHPQEITFDQIKFFDIFIGIMWKRFGSPTKYASSGTENEFRVAFECFKEHKKPKISFFFSQKKYALEDNEEIQQISKVITFQSELSELGIIERYDGLEDFADKVERCLIKRIDELEANNVVSQELELVSSNGLGYKPDMSLFMDDINATLLSSCLSDSLAPKHISEIFVCPPLKESSNNISDKGDNMDLETLCNSSDNYILLGGKESGKTMILNYILYNLCQKYEKKIPVYIHFDSINHNNKKSLLKLITNFLSIRRQEVEELLKTNEVVILLDDINFEDFKRMKAVKWFLGEYDKIRLIVTTLKGFHNSLGINDIPPLFDLFKKIYIQSYTLKEIFKLMDIWFFDSNRDLKELKKKILGILHFTNMPKTPLNISLLLWIIEKSKKDNKLINKATLVEAFIETVLEKFLYNNFDKPDIIDFRTKEHFLSFLGEKMVRGNKYYIKYENLVSITTEYFNDMGDEKINIKNVIDYFLIQGILIDKDGFISFRFKCVGEFFIAKRMIDNKDFYNHIIKKDIYLLFKSEIDYLTGLQRNNKELLVKLSNWLEEYFENLTNGEKIDITSDKFEDLIDIEMSILDEESLLLDCLSKDDNYVIKEVEDFPVPISNEDQNMTKISKNIINEVKYFESLLILSFALKNCEFVPKEIKTDITNKCLEKWSALTIYSMIKSEDFFKKDIKEQLGDYIPELKKEKIDNVSEKNDELAKFIKFMTPIFIQGFASETLGTDKLQYSLKEIISQEKSILMVFIATFIYADLEFKGGVKYIKNLVEKVKQNKTMIRLIYMKLLSLYIMARNVTQIEKLIVDIYINHIISIKGAHNRNVHKQEFLKKLKEKRKQVKVR